MVKITIKNINVKYFDNIYFHTNLDCADSSCFGKLIKKIYIRAMFGNVLRIYSQLCLGDAVLDKKNSK